MTTPSTLGRHNQLLTPSTTRSHRPPASFPSNMPTPDVSDAEFVPHETPEQKEAARIAREEKMKKLVA